MKGRTIKSVSLGAVVALSLSAHADVETVDLNPPDEGSVSREEGLQAWARIYDVASHPRCANCHVGADNLPMWSGPSYGETRPHGMHIDAGVSRIGASGTKKMLDECRQRLGLEPLRATDTGGSSSY